MKRRMLLSLFFIFLFTLIGCGRPNEGSAEVFHAEGQSGTAELEASEPPETLTDRGLEALKEQYPEYFALSSFKGIEVYVWAAADGAYRCGMMSGTNRMKTAPEIRALEESSLSIAEAKTILEEIGVEADSILVIPITQPYENGAGDTDISEPYVIDEEHAEQIYEQFESARTFQ